MITGNGTYKGKVVAVSLEVISDKNLPILKVVFAPNSVRNGSIHVPFEGTNVDKIYFLSTEIATKGPNAGRSQLEILREDLKATYDYTGTLEEGSLQSLIGSEYELVVESYTKGDKSYPRVKWVNKVGTRKSFAAKPLPAEILAKLNAAFLGKSVEQVTSNPADFFARLQNG